MSAIRGTLPLGIAQKGNGMQIGSTELLIILIVVIVAYGFYKARSASPTRSASDRQAKNSQAGGGNTPGGNAWSEDPASKTRAANPASSKDPYVVLNVPRNASKDEVVTAYKRLAQMYHPDKVAGLAPEYHLIAETKMKEINTAYEQIRDRGWR
jgi:Sec-independent protein translocase protein TatA